MVLGENGTNVAAVYLLIRSIFYDCFRLAEIAILLTVYAVVTHYLRRRSSTHQSAHRGLQWIHGIFCGILFVLFVAILALRITVVVWIVEPGYNFSSWEPLLSSVSKLTLAYNVLYMCFSLEVIALAGIVLFTSHKQGITKIVSAFMPAAVLFPS